MLPNGDFMSEYQYYEFCSINKPLTSEARKEMSLLSSRANVGTHNASYVYNYGDFRGNSDTLLLKYFDVFFYISNFGTMRLTLKYATSEMDVNKIKEYCIKHVIACKEHGEYVLLDIYVQNEEGFGWTEGEGLLPDLLPLYDEIKAKNYHFLDIVAAINDEWSERKEGSVDAVLSGNKVVSAAQETFLKNIGIEYHKNLT